MTKSVVLLMLAISFATVSLSDPVFLGQGHVPDFGLYLHGVAYADCPKDHFC